MLCFEVSRNGQKLCVAGIGDFGVLTAMVTWVAHHPEKLARWAAASALPTQPVELDLDVSGRCTLDLNHCERLKWIQSGLAVGDEIRIRVIETDATDEPQSRERDSRQEDNERKEEFVRQTAKELGWELREGNEGQ